MKHLIFTVLLCYSLLSFTQEEQNLDILVTDSTWLKEIIHFPLGFAPDLNYTGFEDLRFAKAWRNPESEEFFSYVFIWNINLNQKPTKETVETDLKRYYDGLMTAVNKNKDYTIPETEVALTQDTDSTDLPFFKGTMQVYDSFVTRQVQTFYLTVETLYCETTTHYKLYFKVSTKNYDEPIWDKFETITLNTTYCK